MYIKKSQIVGISLAMGQAASHLVMIEPHPYNLDTEPLLQVGPLSASLPFPCQGNTQHAEQVTKVTAGSTQLVKFWGSAVHGGGSCQFSVAYGDAPPADPSKWHTIYSIIGGCPSDAQGNIPSVAKDPHGRENGPQCGNDSGTECTRQFQIPIPKDMKNGPAVFAWTWFNKIGNREMYMNCAPIEVVGGTEDSVFVDGLPPIFRANIPGECTTDGIHVIGFPNPGDFGKVYQDITPDGQGTCEAAADPAFKDSTGGESPSSVPSGAGSTRAPSAAPSYAASSSMAPTSASGAPTSATSGAGSAPSYQATTTSAAKGEAPTASGKPGWAEGMQPCKSSGPMECFSPRSFGICKDGWAVPQAAPAGTSCVDGQLVHAAIGCN